MGGFLPSERNHGIAEESGGCNKDDGLGHQSRLGPSLGLLATPELISGLIKYRWSNFAHRVRLPNNRFVVML